MEAVQNSLEEIWETAPGWQRWFATVDHKTIGLRYLVTAFIFLLAGGLEALALRVQLARPNQTFLTPEHYNQIFTMHGITMIFLYALPVLSGFSNYLWPLLLGTRDMAFPRLNAFSYWIFLFAGIFLYMSFPLWEAPDDGWFNYVPLAGPIYSIGPNIDVYALGMVLLGISTTVGAANFIVTFFRLRAPGMSISRVPILVWGTLTASVANLIVIPSVSLAFFLLWLDRQAGTHFFDTGGDGRPLLWQHLFWIFAHPWVYVVVLPAMGIVSDALPVFCRRPLVAYAGVALSTVATMLIGFEVWIHHMFATGLSPLVLAFFGAASMVISIPSSIAVFSWIATIWTGRPVFKTPFLFFAGFVLLFVIGGVSGVMTAAVPLDLQLNETYFVIAHMHYVLIGINVFPVVGGIYYWFPKFTGRLMNETLGKWSFWIMFIGFNLGFFPMHIVGLRGMPRRVYTYADGMGWNDLNMTTTIGSFLFAAGILVFIANVIFSLKQGAPAGKNPWDAPTLEWATSSPPPPYNFAYIPVVASRHPLWEDRLGESPDRSSFNKGDPLLKGRQTLGTTPLEAEPESVLKMPEDSLAPFSLSLFSAFFFGGLLLNAAFFTGVMLLGIIVSLASWLWPENVVLASGGKNALPFWGIWTLITTEASLFVYLLFSYFYLMSQTTQHWPPEGLPKLAVPLINTAILLLSSVFVWASERSLRKMRKKRSLLMMAGAILLGAAFVVIQYSEWRNKHYGLTSHTYGSLYFTITGFHLLHVIVGLIILLVVLLWTRLGLINEQHSRAITVGGLYWHFVDTVWVFVFTSFFLVPYL